ncbi:MAG TPA: hypothetical protein VM163_03920 [bacterium]|nr:hypothetical protein [bacterium]
MAILVLLSAVFALTSCTVAQAGDYPWVHYFDTPSCADHPSIHFAFPDGEGNVIVSTGDWVPDYWPNEKYYDYRPGALYRVNEGVKQTIDAPENTYVLDAAVDGQGRTWIISAEASSYHVYYRNGLCVEDKGYPLPQSFGYGRYRFPESPLAEAYGGLDKPALGTLRAGRFVRLPEVTEAIPGTPRGICVDAQGHVFLMTSEWDPWEFTAYFVSWWGAEGPESLRTLDLWQIIPNSWLRDYPQFAPDGVAYLLIVYNAGGPGAGYDYALLRLDPKTGEYCVYRNTDYAYLDSEVRCFYIDPMGIIWLGTEDGLVRFDGQTLSRWTTENSGLPYNAVRQIVYDEIDDVYYVISEKDIGWDTSMLFSMLSPVGDAIGAPFILPTVANRLFQFSKVFRDGRGVFWLCPYEASRAYSYDHERVMQWYAADWMELVSNVHYVGSTASGRTFCVAGGYGASCVMIW